MMPEIDKYKHFGEQDFINDAYFQQWIIAPDAELDGFWNRFLETHPEKRQAMEGASQLLKAIGFREHWPAEENIEEALEKALASIRATENNAGVAKVKRLYNYRWMAAAVLLFAVCGMWFLRGRDNVKQPSIAIAKQLDDIAPGGNRAILTLADGSKMVLDSLDSGAITKQGDVTVIKMNDGQLAYNSDGAMATAVLYNTITTPMGGQYQLVLADGTRVWLNAASSLRFSTAFAGKDRRVEMTGEGYFEVAHNVDKPFHVSVRGMDVKVLGTEFNINAYEDEDAIRTTLLQGSVKVSSGREKAILKPGQQARLSGASSRDKSTDLKILHDVNIDEVVAWKNGRFLFNSANIESVMRQVARWYDLEVVYENKINGTISGDLPRSENISQILKILEATGKIDFKINGKQIMVKSN